MMKLLMSKISLSRSLSSSSLSDIQSVCSRCINPRSPDHLQQDSKTFVQIYSTSKKSEKNEMIKLLANNCGVNHDNLKAAISKYEKNSNAAYDVYLASDPRYSKIFQSIGNLEMGVKFVTDFRSDVLEYMRSGETTKEKLMPLRRLESTLKDLLTLWFCLSNLKLMRLTWQTSADILQKVAKEEAVHPIQGLIDMQQRLGACRRCFVFFHEAMPREPLVIVYVALTKKISDNVVEIMKDGNLTEDNEKLANTAIYYSITSTQPGLRGIDLGNLLIKQVAAELMAENPNIIHHSTLSPIPGFRTWLLRSLQGASEFGEVLDSHVLDYLRSFDNLENSTHEELKSQLVNLIKTNSLEKYAPLKNLFLYFAAVYLLKAKNSSGYALNPVANFHLRNGAEMYKLNWAGNNTRRGIEQSLGIMVNYRYVMDNVTKNNENYVNNQLIAISDEFSKNFMPKAKL
uniref:Malonyl-CoA decarboxylase n=1 Tax=Panagrolaimus superbus TaxID=310955 RepID=A0A914Z1U3_9BILA